MKESKKRIYPGKLYKRKKISTQAKRSKKAERFRRKNSPSHLFVCISAISDSLTYILGNKWKIKEADDIFLLQRFCSSLYITYRSATCKYSFPASVNRSGLAYCQWSTVHRFGRGTSLTSPNVVCCWDDLVELSLTDNKSRRSLVKVARCGEICLSNWPVSENS